MVLEFDVLKKQIVDETVKELNSLCSQDNELIVAELMRKSSDIVAVIILIMDNQPDLTTAEILDELQHILLFGKTDLAIQVPDGLTNPGFGGMFSGLATYLEKRFSPLHKSVQTDEGTQELRSLLSLFITQIRFAGNLNKEVI